MFDRVLNKPLATALNANTTKMHACPHLILSNFGCPSFYDKRVKLNCILSEIDQENTHFSLVGLIPII